VVPDCGIENTKRLDEATLDDATLDDATLDDATGGLGPVPVSTPRHDATNVLMMTAEAAHKRLARKVMGLRLSPIVVE
jgi:hypothetical protein